MPTLKLATRGSSLALAQSQWVADQLMAEYANLHVSLVPIQTTGDQDRSRSLKEIGGKGLFTKEVDLAVLQGDADFSVHSLKDLPVTAAPGLVLASVPQRASSEDVLVLRSPGAGMLEDLPPESIIACGSLRRQAQLLRARPDFQIIGIRGNVGTRLRLLKESDWAGTVLASAGLERLGIDVPCLMLGGIMLPAASQGALGLIAREDQEETSALLKGIQHSATRAAVDAERAFVKGLGADCHAPVGVRSHVDDTGECIELTGAVFSTDGSKAVQITMKDTGKEATSLGLSLARDVLAKGGQAILESYGE